MTGYVTHPDPLTSIMNAVQHDPPNEIIISTLPSYKSRWLRGDLIARVQRATGPAGRARDVRPGRRPSRSAEQPARSES